MGREEGKKGTEIFGFSRIESDGPRPDRIERKSTPLHGWSTRRHASLIAVERKEGGGEREEKE